MTAKHLIEKLMILPLDLEVHVVWDGEPRTCVEHVWLTRDNKNIMLAGSNDVVYNDKNRPDNAPHSVWWSLPK